VDRRKPRTDPSFEGVVNHRLPIPGAHLQASQKRSTDDQLTSVQAEIPHDSGHALAVAGINDQPQTAVSA
jgi:hypothetical protein